MEKDKVKSDLFHVFFEPLYIFIITVGILFEN